MFLYFLSVISKTQGKKTRKKITERRRLEAFDTMVARKNAVEVQESAEKTMPVTAAEEPKKKKKRAEGRPHKRLLEPMLYKRKEDVRRKLDVHKAKCVLLQERLELYEREITLRAEDA